MPRRTKDSAAKDCGGKDKGRVDDKASEELEPEAVTTGFREKLPSGVKGLQKPYREYIVALEQALDDKVITVDEMRVLEYLREEYGISRDEHDILMAVMLKRLGGRLEEWLPGDEFFSDLFSGRKYIKPKPYEFCTQKD